MAQVDNSELRTILAPYFIPRTEFYGPDITRALTIPTIQSLTGLRGFWPTSTAGVRTLGDLSGHGFPLTLDPSGFEPTLKYLSSGAPYLELDGVNDRPNAVDAAHWDIIGTENYITNKGLTMCAWVWFGDAVGSLEYILSKTYAAGTNTSYYLARNSTGYAEFGVSVDGSAVVTVNSSTDTLDEGAWYFVCGRYNPSAELKVWVNGTTYINTNSIPASIHNGTAGLFMGARDDAATPADFMDGRISMAWICAAALSDASIYTLYEISRSMYGV